MHTHVWYGHKCLFNRLKLKTLTHFDETTVLAATRWQDGYLLPCG